MSKRFVFHVPSRRVLAGVAVVGLAVTLTACDGGGDRANTSTAPSAQPASTVAPSAAASQRPRLDFGNQDFDPARIATVIHSTVEVWDAPGGELVQVLDSADVLTVPEETALTLLVKERQGEWLEVFLPVRPNGSTGWIHDSDVTIASTDYELSVYLSDYQVVLTEAGDEVARYDVGIGTAERPTPGGTYFIRELLVPPNPGGEYGPYAYGLSGFSPVLDEFRGGDAVIGLHGTNQPDSIGNEVSSGCIRLDNAMITELVEEYQLPLGTPVHIYA